MTFEDMKKIVVDTLNCEEEKVTMEASLTEDLEADSLDAVELNMALEDAFGVSIPDEELANMKTVGDIFNYLTALQRLLCRRDGQRSGGFFLRTPVAGADAGAGGDPLVAGVHGAAQLFIGDRAAGQSSAGGDQLQTVHARFASPI